jgi:hypothetical protein
MQTHLVRRTGYSVLFLRRLGKIYMFLLVVGFGVASLFATGLLLVMQILEDFR